MTPKEAESVRQSMEKYYQGKFPKAKITLVSCPMPRALAAFPTSGEFAAQIRVNGKPVPTPVQKMQVGDEEVESPSTFIISLQAAQMTMDHLKQHGIDPYFQFHGDLPLIGKFADTRASAAPDID